MHRLGGQANTAGSNAGAIHRGWMNLKGTVTGYQDQVLLAEAERGESVATRAYKDALTGMLPPTVSDLIAQQYAGICDAHARITALAKARAVIV